MRRIGLWGAVELGIAAMIGGSVFTLTGFIAALSGPSLPLTFLLTAVLAALPTILVYAELAAARPEAGGGYQWIRQALGPNHGHFSGWFSWCAHTVACAVYALSFGYYSSKVLDELILPVSGASLPGPERLWRVFLALAAVLVLSWVNHRGLTYAAMVGRLAVSASIAVLLLFVSAGLYSALFGDPRPRPVGDLMPFGVGGMLAGMGLVFLAFQGFEVVAQAGEEMKSPAKNMPRSLLISFGLVLGLYLLVVTAAVVGIPGDVPGWRILADAGEGALVEAASYLPMAGVLEDLVMLGGTAVALAALNATVFSASRVFYAMARQGRSLPAEVGTLHPKYGSPTVGIVASALLMTVLIAALPIKDIAAMADLVFFFIFTQVHLAFIQFRRKFPEMHRPFRAPLYPWLSVGAICVFAVLAAQIVRVTPWAVSFYLAWLVLGMLIQRVYVERHESGEFAQGKVVEFGERLGESTGYLVLLPVVFPEGKWREALPLAASLVRQKNGELFVLIIYPDVSLGSRRRPGDPERNRLHQQYQTVVRAAAGLGVTYTVRVQAGSDVSDTVLLTVEKLDADLLMVPYESLPGQPLRAGRRRPGITGRDFARVLRESQCDLLIFGGLTGLPARRALVPVTESSHNGLLGKMISMFITLPGTQVTVLHVSAGEKEEPKRWDHLLGELGVGKSASLRTKWVVGGDEVGQIVMAADGCDMVLMAARRRTTFAPVILGPTATAVLQRCPKPVVVCHSHSDLQEFVFLERLADAAKGGVRKARQV